MWRIQVVNLNVLEEQIARERKEHLDDFYFMNSINIIDHRIDFDSDDYTNNSENNNCVDDVEYDDDYEIPL